MSEYFDAQSSGAAHWEQLAAQPEPAWYLDPLAARQKRETHQALIRKWAPAGFNGVLLKTDLFEEANGADQILFDVFPGAGLLGIDIAWHAVCAAARRRPDPKASFVVTDVRRLALRPACIDLVVSTSTLDHFDSPAEIVQALGEIARVLRPGGVAVITLDNPENPLYWLLRFAGRRGWAPFCLGESVPLRKLILLVQQAGLEVTASELLLHNPRIVSTLLFLALRRLLGRFGDPPIRSLLKLFSLLGRLPTRRFSACFVAVRAVKPVG